ncbi:MAG: hypothetical protein K9K80_01320 [Spirochaetia bacterium]|nr:hypothetical protein [Spirochaetia bacterium]
MGAGIYMHLNFESEKEGFAEKLDTYLDQFVNDHPVEKTGTSSRYLHSYFSFPTVTNFLEDLIPISEGGKISLEMEVEETENIIFEAKNGKLIKDESQELDYTS